MTSQCKGLLLLPVWLVELGSRGYQFQVLIAGVFCITLHPGARGSSHCQLMNVLNSISRENGHCGWKALDILCLLKVIVENSNYKLKCSVIGLMNSVLVFFCFSFNWGGSLFRLWAGFGSAVSLTMALMLQLVIGECVMTLCAVDRFLSIACWH